MSRIVYLGFPNGEIAGGQKMILRHIETLRDLGFEAVFWRGAANVMPPWLEHRAPVEAGTPFQRDDILVLPSDAPNAIARLVASPHRKFIFCQNQFSLAATGVKGIDLFPAEALPVFLSPGRVCAASIRRIYPKAEVEIIPCFADERIFRPSGERTPGVAFAPRKRPLEAQAIRVFFQRGRPEYAHLPWRAMSNIAETEVAKMMAGATLFLSLSRFEAVGMTPLEAMACGCVCAGFTGVGGRDFATPENGFWAPDDDLEGAAEALGRAADLVATGGAPLTAYHDAARVTAADWSYGKFRATLEEVWMRLAPDARVSAGPLD